VAVLVRCLPDSHRQRSRSLRTHCLSWSAAGW